MAATTALREALNEGISSGSLVDTKFILYSRKDASGRVFRPKALYASSHVLKTVPYFSDLLFGNFAESQPREFVETIDEEESAEGYGYLSDSDLEDGDVGNVPPSATTARPKARLLDMSSKDRIVCEGHMERVEKGKVVKIPDMAFVTFQAFLLYLYTGAIEFAPFSSKNRGSRKPEIVTSCGDMIPSSSPKSVYRLADKYDVPSLKDLALSRIRGELAGCDIVNESFSRFASQYDEIRSLYAEQLVYTWVGDSTNVTPNDIEDMIDSFSEGDLDHATEIISALWKTITRDGDIKAPSDASLPAKQVRSPTLWNVVKAALINSIRTGVFFDRKYWARHTDARGILKPIYFSSAIMNDTLWQLENLVKYLIDQNALMSGPEMIDIESDCEEGQSGVRGEVPDVKGGTEEQIRAVLVTGSFSAWKSLFFYRLTDEISFAPLKSQGVDYRLKYIRENTVVAAPAPCSPRSMFLLATLLDIKALRDSSLADIKAKVSSHKVMGEISSWASAIRLKFMCGECELFIPALKDPKFICLVNENIGRVPNGSSSHFVGVLKLGLRKAVELKKRGVAGGAMLSCPSIGCPWCTNRVLYSSVGSEIRCPRCNCNYLRCSGCFRDRTTRSSTCSGCRKRFM